ncbi:MAG: NAD(P)H-hydrate dehydratase [Firmicutes bacterium]|nr:NAD(P)H-hydrate dehydratase [Alicyclobacillaceae bacterium]MCL6497475.1 NAD(P)H-hydrate dehydratase [Bacillota bacterium]
MNPAYAVWGAAEARAHDQAAVERGVDPAWLMEVAGAKAAGVLTARAPQGPVTVLVGPGQNGGDGLVVARYLARQRPTRVVLLRGVPHFAGADRLVVAARGYGAEILPESDLPRALAQSQWVVDAVLGTGLTGPLREWAYSALSRVAEVGLPVWALDLVSGVESDTGVYRGPDGLRAEGTVTFGALKWGQVLYPGAGRGGEVWVADIGLPSLGDEGARLPLPAAYRRLLPPVLPDRHKYRRGRVVVIGGSEAMPGAPVLAAEAALRAGAGVVELWVPEALAARVRPSPALLVRPVGRPGERVLRLTPAEEAMLSRADAVVFGPGGGRALAPNLLARILALGRPVVVDGDGLGLLTAVPGADRATEVVLTPHEGEMARLLGCSPAAVHADRVGAFRAAAARYAGTVVLKGPFTIVGDRRHQAVNPSGGPELATAGSGDVLSGIIAALWAQGLAGREAATLGVYLHGWCGTFAAEHRGRAVVAPDVIDALPEAWAAVEAERRPWGLPEGC